MLQSKVFGPKGEKHEEWVLWRTSDGVALYLIALLFSQCIHGDEVKEN
jgi:hypothetical protein